MPLYRQTGDLLTCDADWIVQQCNCLNVRPHGLSADIAKAFPQSNPYALRRAIGSRNLAQAADRGIPGTVVRLGRVCCLLAQWGPGKIGSFQHLPPSDPPETWARREEWFQACLDSLDGTCGSMAFPDHIGCGMAGGNWERYEEMIKQFSEKNHSLDVYIIKLESFW